MKLTLYLFRESVASFEHCLKPQTEQRKYRDITNAETDGLTDTHRVIMLETETKTPEWANFFGNYIQSGAYEKFESSAPATVILFKISDGEGSRIMAATNGAAYSLLDHGLVEKNFGLRTTLNSIIPSQIKSLEYKNMAARHLQRRESAAMATSIANFGFAFENELIKSVSGRTQDEELGRTMTGSHSLKVSIPDLHITQLKIVGEQAFSRYRQTKYQEHFDFIDNVVPVEAQDTISELNELLLEQLQKPTPLPALGVSHSNQGQYSDSAFLQVTARGIKERFDEVDIHALHGFLRSNVDSLSIETLQQESYVYGYSADEKPNTRKVHLYKLLTLDIQKDGTLYVLRNGQWYAIQPNHIQNAAQQIEQHITDTLVKTLPAWSAQTPEKHFSQDLGKGWVDLTSEWLQPRGRGRIFAADAFNEANSTLVWFARTHSATSHDYLIERAITAAELVRDQDSKMIDYLRQTTPLFSGSENENKTLNTLSFCIVIGFRNALLEEIHAFDTLALSRGFKALQRLGFELQIQPLRLDKK